MSQKFPRRFGKYILLRPLAKGGMGEIYIAAVGEMGGFEKLCVIKKVIREKADKAKANRFLDEAKVVLRLSHSCLVTTFDAGEVDGEFYIAMELVEGKDLREVWNRCVRTRERIPLDVALHVAREVARALSYVHGYGNLKLVHRDVAPPNILLAYVGDIKLTDFGLARSVLKQEHTAPGIVYGRAAYLAPEQARGEVADARTDIYTLGVVLWELLTGQQFLQISGLDPATALAIVRHPKLVKPSLKAPWIPAELDAVVMKALAVEREERFRTADEMRRALNEVIANIAPRAGADRVAEFLENIYEDVIPEDQRERDGFLAKVATMTDEDGRSRSPSPPQPSSVRDAVTGPAERSRFASAHRPITGVPLEPVVRASTRRPLPARVRPAEAPAPTGGPPRLPGLPPSPDRPTLPPLRKNQAPPVPARVQPASIFDDGEAFAQKFIGRVLGGRYRIIESIGEGGMGQVFAAEHVTIGKRIAVKVLNPSCSARADLVERFRLEARAASKIGHPNIVDVTDFGTTDEGLVYYVMEQLHGIDLAEVLAQERKVDQERAVQITIQMCQALHAAHQADIIHRDLKPENIFLEPRGAQGDAVKIIDFGLARSLQESAFGPTGRPLTNPGTPIGTPEYMAPEQADGKPADARSDIYAVGAILYEMITGQPAFSGQGYAEVLVRKVTDKVKSPSELMPGIPKALDDIIVATMDRDPSRRPQTMAQLEYELTKLSRGRGKAVAALLGIEPDHHDTPTPRPITIQGHHRDRKDAALRTIGELRAGALSHADDPPTPPVEAVDLTVPAATVFPEYAAAQASVAPVRAAPGVPVGDPLSQTLVDPISPGVRDPARSLSSEPTSPPPRSVGLAFLNTSEAGSGSIAKPLIYVVGVLAAIGLILLALR
ncbi:MAG: serine/threonine-protein kinase [Deltaproteobacteria bacterium]|nr:serine/threonine-protein kinase [Deltaproteobacteria bacterium]